MPTNDAAKVTAQPITAVPSEAAKVTTTTKARRKKANTDD